MVARSELACRLHGGGQTHQRTDDHGPVAEDRGADDGQDGDGEDGDEGDLHAGEGGEQADLLVPNDECANRLEPFVRAVEDLAADRLQLFGRIPDTAFHHVQLAERIGDLNDLDSAFVEERAGDLADAFDVEIPERFGKGLGIGRNDDLDMLLEAFGNLAGRERKEQRKERRNHDQQRRDDDCNKTALD